MEEEKKEEIKKNSFFKTMWYSIAKIEKYPSVQIGFMEEKKLLIKTANRFSLTAKSVASYNHSFELLVKDLKRYRKNGYRVIVMSPSA